MRAKKAAMRHGHPSRALQLIVVAGGDGKTTTARLLSELLRESGKRVAVFTNRQSFIEAIPYTLEFSRNAQSVHQALAAARKQRCDVVVLEMTESLRRCQVLNTLDIDLALIVSDGPGVEELLDQPLKYAVLPSGFNIESLPVAPHQLISVGDNELADARISNTKLYRKGTELTMTVDHQTVIEVATYLIGQANAKNVAFAVAAGYVLGVPVDSIAEGVARLERLPGNYHVLESASDYQIVVDSASSLDAAQSVIDSAHQLSKRRLLVVADTTIDTEIMQTIKPKTDRLVSLTGHSSAVSDEAPTLEEAVAIALRAARKDDTVLLLGKDLAAVSQDDKSRAEQIVEAYRG